MISLAHAEELHNNLINNFGGGKGIRDKGSLLAALNRPYATFDQQDLWRLQFLRALLLITLLSMATKELLIP